MTSLTKHIPNVSIPGQGPKFILAPSVLFIVVPGKLHHLQTQNKRPVKHLVCGYCTSIWQKQDIRMQMSLKPSSADVHRSSSTIENVGFYALDDKTSGAVKHG